VGVYLFGAEPAFGQVQCKQGGERRRDGHCGDQADRADENREDGASDDRFSVAPE
jgi:hypothetical protein